MPDVEPFVDTNILLYSVSTQIADAAKCAIAKNLLNTRNWVWSGQVAAEFVNASTSKRRAPTLPWNGVEHYIRVWSGMRLIEVDLSIVQTAMSIAQRYMISYYDAQIIAAAKAAGSVTLYSEDLNHGQVYDGVRVENPFLTAAPSTSGS